MTSISRMESRRTYTIAAALAVIWWVGGPPSLVSATAQGLENPKQVVETTSSSVIDVLRDKALSSEQKREQIEKIVYSNVDFDTLSRLVLARNWRSFSEKQREDFKREFKRHLSVTYGNSIDDYQNESVHVLGEREEARGDRTVQTKVHRGAGAEEFLVNYRLRQRDGRWWIIDVIVEGVSMVANFRSQFQSILSNGGPDRLLELLREKNANGEALKS